MASNDVIVALRTAGLAAFTSAMSRAGDSVEGVGKSADKTSAHVEGAGKKAGKSAKGWRSMAGGMGAAAAGAASIAAVAGFAKSATSAAVDLGEEVSKSSVVFGDSAKGLQDWSKTSATALGMSRTEALSAMGTLGNMLVPMGFARDKAAGMSKNMVQLAADMASFNNADPAETLDALRAGLAGESEPLRRFGVSLSDARLKAEAMNMGIYKGKGPLTAAQKAQATYALVLKDTKDQQGDVARTSDSLANRQRALKAQWTDITATVGKALIPVFTQLANVLGFVMRNFTVFGPILAALTVGMIAYKVATLASAIATAGLNASILLIPLAIAAVIAGLFIAYKKIDWFRAAVDAAFKWIKTAAVNVFNWIKNNWVLLASILGGPFVAAALVIVRNWDKIKAAARSAVDTIKRVWSGVVGWFKGMGGSIVNAIGAGIRGAAGALLSALGSLFDALPLPGIVKSKVKHALGFAYGGVMPHTGAAIVGERGPELMQLPGGTRITPLPTGGGGGGLVAAPALGGVGAGRTQTTAHFYLDRRLIATAVADDTADRKARR
jgi:hypothetical protein